MQRYIILSISPNFQTYNSLFYVEEYLPAVILRAYCEVHPHPRATHLDEQLICSKGTHNENIDTNGCLRPEDATKHSNAVSDESIRWPS